MSLLRRNPDSFDEDTLVELAALADGSLPVGQRAALRQRIASSSALAEALERQRIVVSAVRGATVPAPAALRARLEQRAERTRPWLRIAHPRPLLGAVASAAAVAAAALVVVATNNGASEPSVGDAAALGSTVTRQGAPARNPSKPALLRQTAAGLPFPNFEAKFGYRAVGARRSTIDGRHATTVFYEKGERTLAYTIVSGDALGWPDAGQVTRRGGVKFASFDADGRAAVTWLRRDHTCVLSGERVRDRELLALASWTGKGTIPA